MLRDQLLYVADMVSAGEAVPRCIEGVTFEAFSGDDEKRAAVERQLFVIGEAAARMSPEWKDARPAVPWRQIVGLRHEAADFGKQGASLGGEYERTTS